jgi:hypothetical protein
MKTGGWERPISPCGASLEAHKSDSMGCNSCRGDFFPQTCRMPLHPRLPSRNHASRRCELPVSKTPDSSRRQLASAATGRQAVGVAQPGFGFSDLLRMNRERPVRTEAKLAPRLRARLRDSRRATPKTSHAHSGINPSISVGLSGSARRSFGQSKTWFGTARRSFQHAQRSIWHAETSSGHPGSSFGNSQCCSRSPRSFFGIPQSCYRDTRISYRCTGSSFWTRDRNSVRTGSRFGSSGTFQRHAAERSGGSDKTQPPGRRWLRAMAPSESQRPLIPAHPQRHQPQRIALLAPTHQPLRRHRRGLVCWHPCRDASNSINAQPVVSLRSTTGYTLGCLRHPPYVPHAIPKPSAGAIPPSRRDAST